jgi:hypothetical protein
MKTQKRILSLFLSFALVCGIFGTDTAGAFAAQSPLPDGEINTNIFQDDTKYDSIDYFGLNQVKNSPDFNLSWDEKPVGGETAKLAYNYSQVLKRTGIHIIEKRSVASVPDGSEHWFRIDANGTTVSSFKLSACKIGMDIKPCNKLKITITGYKASGGTVEKAFIPGTPGGPDNADYTALLDFRDKSEQITGFRVTYQYLNPTTNQTNFANFRLITFTIADAGLDQTAPTFLTGTAPTVYGGSDGKITGTTSAMEYKLDGAANYTPVLGDKIDGLSAGTYYVRYAAKAGYFASPDTVVTVPDGANQDQTAPTFLTGTAPTVSGGSDGKITGTTSAMEYKLDGAANYTPVLGDKIDNLTAGTYRVRYAAKAGYNPGSDTVVTVPDGNRNQSAPTGLAGTAPTASGGSDGKITGTTNAMEYKRDGAANYTPVLGDKIDNLTAGTYRVRYAAKAGYNASSEIAVTVPDGANRSQSAPTGLTGHAPTTSGGSNGKITGVNTNMEYKRDGTVDYTSVPGNEIDNLTAGTYRIRYAAKPGYNASPDAAVTVPSGAQAPSGGGCPLTPSLPSTVSDAASNTTADLTGATFPAGVTNVTLTVTKPARGGKQAADFSAALLADAKSGVINIPEMCDMSLLDQNGTPVSFTGSVTVRIPVPAGVRGTPHVFRYEADTKTFTDMNAKVEKGFLVFTTAHFSRYAVAGTGNAIVLDTLNYQMPIGGKYQIGLRLPRTKAASVKFYSTNSKTAAVTKMKNGNYQVDGKNVGTVWIMFDAYDGKNKFLAHASVRVDVKIGVRPRGDSTRQYAIF